jgi:hypothetical protein
MIPLHAGDPVMTNPERTHRWSLRERVQPWLRSQGYFHFLLGLLFSLFLLRPFSDVTFLGPKLEEINLIAVLVCSILAVSASRIRGLIATILGLPLAFAELLPDTDATDLKMAAAIAALAFIGFVTLSLLQDVFRQRKVNSGTVSASLCVYLLLAVLWSFVYKIIEYVEPGSFQGGPALLGDLAHDSAAQSTQYFYFSLVTLTTLGYGDISPISRAAQSMATMEAVVGQLYLVVIVARLVAMEIAASMRPGAADDS